MSRKALRKDFYMEIRKSLGRFLSIFFIVAIGVAFFSGIRASEPDMRLSGDEYFDEKNLMDIQVISTLGLTEEDVKSLQQLAGIGEVEAGCSSDVLCKQGDSEKVVHVMSLLPTMNQVTVEKGRLPQNANECVVDVDYFHENGYQLGDTITFESGTEDSISDILKNNTYTIVGAVSSPCYVSFNRGSTTIGTGTINGFACVLEESFNLDVYTEIYATAKGAKELVAFTDAYDQQIDTAVTEVESIQKEREEARYQSVVDEANGKLKDAKQELADAKQEAESKLNDAKNQLADGQAQLTDAQVQITDGQNQLNAAQAQLTDGQTQLNAAQEQLTAGQSQLDAGQAQLAEGRSQLDAAQAQLTNGQNQLQEVQEQLTAGQNQLNAGQEQLAEGRSQLDAAQVQLTEGQKQLTAAQNQLEEKRVELETQKAELDNAQEQLNQQYSTLAEKKAELDAGIAELNQLKEECAALKESGASDMETLQRIAMLELQIAVMEPQITEAQEQIAQAQEQLDAAQSKLDHGMAQLAQGQEQLDAAQAELDVKKQELTAGQAELDVKRQELEAGQAELDARKQELEAGQAEVNAKWQELTAGQAELNARKQELEAKQSEVNAKQQELEAGQTEINAKQQELNAGQTELDAKQQELWKVQTELEAKQQELTDAQNEYEKAKIETQEKLADGEKEIRDAEIEISKIEYPTWYVYDRNYLTEYSGYGENADRMRAIGEVFPVLFFLVAALISLTTMTRMVEEQRTQIGTMKALGYSRHSIAAKYLGYAFLATILGCVAGVLFGEKVFPYVIVVSYKIMYSHIPNVVIPYDLDYALMASAAAIACTILATFFSCNKELKEQAAQLMRPPTPKQGKRVLMERIPFIWNRMNFTWKATVRNLVRYKKRFFMTIFGIGGCMALLLVGFGLQDSIFNIGNLQYGELQTYDGCVILDDTAGKEEIAETVEELQQDSRVDHSAEGLMQKVTVKNGEESGEVFLTVPNEQKVFEQFFEFRNRVTKEMYSLTDDGVILTEKMASKLDVKSGDSIVIEDGAKGEIEVKVSAVCENYVQHYLYMTHGLYEELYGNAPEYNSVFFTVKDGDAKTAQKLGEKILKREGALSITYTSDFESELGDILGSLDMVIAVLVISAGLLAFVVLYNLNNINITERKRELATLKVLGFYPKEVAAYVYRENIILTILGALVGMGLGKLLHRFIITTVEVESAMFGRNIDPSSFLYGFLITVGFSLFVNGVMYFKLKRINMVESLKSVE